MTKNVICDIIQTKTIGDKMNKKKITFLTDNETHEKFTVALMLAGENQTNALNNCMKEYISRVFAQVSEKYASNSPLSTEAPKAIRRIPRWANNPDQINHKILRAYLLLQKESDKITVYDIEKLCLNADRQDTYVPTFRNNFMQMKIETPKSTGKVFEEKNGFVEIWDRVKDVVAKYEDAFTKNR